jgi:hypothetical protein
VRSRLLVTLLVVLALVAVRTVEIAAGKTVVCDFGRGSPASGK